MASYTRTQLQQAIYLKNILDEAVQREDLLPEKLFGILHTVLTSDSMPSGWDFQTNLPEGPQTSLHGWQTQIDTVKSKNRQKQSTTELYKSITTRLSQPAENTDSDEGASSKKDNAPTSETFKKDLKMCLKALSESLKTFIDQKKQTTEISESTLSRNFKKFVPVFSEAKPEESFIPIDPDIFEALYHIHDDNTAHYKTLFKYIISADTGEPALAAALRIMTGGRHELEDIQTRLDRNSPLRNSYAVQKDIRATDPYALYTVPLWIRNTLPNDLITEKTKTSLLIGTALNTPSSEDSPDRKIALSLDDFNHINLRASFEQMLHAVQAFEKFGDRTNSFFRTFSGGPGGGKSKAANLFQDFSSYIAINPAEASNRPDGITQGDYILSRLKTAAFFAKLYGMKCYFIVDEFDTVLKDADYKRQLNELLDTFPYPVIFITNNPETLDNSLLRRAPGISFPASIQNKILELIIKAFAEHLPHEELTPEEIRAITAGTRELSLAELQEILYQAFAPVKLYGHDEETKDDILNTIYRSTYEQKPATPLRGTVVPRDDIVMEFLIAAREFTATQKSLLDRTEHLHEEVKKAFCKTLDKGWKEKDADTLRLIATLKKSGLKQKGWLSKKFDPETLPDDTPMNANGFALGEGFVFFYKGATGLGKHTAIQFQMAAWGYPDKDPYEPDINSFMDKKSKIPNERNKFSPAAFYEVIKQALVENRPLILSNVTKHIGVEDKNMVLALAALKKFPHPVFFVDDDPEEINNLTLSKERDIATGGIYGFGFLTEKHCQDDMNVAEEDLSAKQRAERAHRFYDILVQAIEAQLAPHDVAIQEPRRFFSKTALWKEPGYPAHLAVMPLFFNRFVDITLKENKGLFKKGERAVVEAFLKYVQDTHPRFYDNREVQDVPQLTDLTETGGPS